MKIISDIMVRDVISVKNTDNVHHARMILKDKNIRHLPVVDSQNGAFLGLLAQGSLLNHAFNMVEKFGMAGLQKREKRTLVAEIMSRECETAALDMDLTQAGTLFMDKKISCLPVVEGQQLKGIVTSVDFVKLALHLLKE